MTNENRHAYLIMAHGQLDVLEKLLLLLDDPRNDIYLHVDQKVRHFDAGHFKRLVKKSSLCFTRRTAVCWGHYSQIQAELLLLKRAAKRNYQYYHLLSGSDLPLRTQDQIHAFFQAHRGREFVHFDAGEASDEVQRRVKHYHWVVNFNTEAMSRFAVNTQKKMEKFQTERNFQRSWPQDISIRKGANWFSITNDLAQYVVSKEPWIRKHFRFSLCGDELFLQTILYNSKFREALYVQTFADDYRGCMRYIDWNRGAPYTFRKGDFQELVQSGRLFARKFSSNVDGEIIDAIFEYVQNQ